VELVVNDMYEIQAPRPDNLVSLFEGQWVSALPGFASGGVGLFADDRISWAIERAGGVDGARVLELGPLEGGHSYMLQAAGAAQVTAIEANTLCYLKCLLVQQLYDLDHVDFRLGNFVPWLASIVDASTEDTFDLVVAAGVLYHLADPLPVLDALCRVSSQVYLWTHYVDFEAMPRTDRRYKRWFVGVEEREFDGRTYPLHRRAYKRDPTKDPKFIGGVHTSTAWIEKPTILDVFAAHGFDVEIAHEMPDHPSGPCASFFARKRG
jgi:SAM-dependent methyltransferase